MNCEYCGTGISNFENGSCHKCGAPIKLGKSDKTHYEYIVEKDDKGKNFVRKIATFGSSYTHWVDING